MTRAAQGALGIALCACAAQAAPPSPAALPPLPAPQSRLVLAGDAGAASGKPLLRALGAFVAKHGARTTLVFLGDDFYPPGDAWRDPEQRDALLGAQLEAGRVAAASWFVPGNHDWDDSLIRGVDAERLRGLAAAVDADPRGEWAPEAGCGGPQRIDRGAFVLVAIDSQWWMLDDAERAASAPPGGCAHPTPLAAERALAAALRCGAAKCAPRILIAHHPLESRGPHGVLPAPGGPLESRLRHAAGVRQDLGADAYQAYVRSIQRATASRPPLLMAAGHDHSLQVLPGAAPPFHVVSGAASKTTAVSGELRYGSSNKGFMSVDFQPSGAVVLRVFEYGEPAACGESRLCETYRQELTKGH